MSLTRIAAPIVILALGAGVIALLVATRPTIEPRPQGDPRPLVRVVDLQPCSIALDIEATGTVEAKGRLTLVAEVGGRLLSLSARVEAGLPVDAGEELARIETIEWRAAVGRSQAKLAQSRLGLAQEEALAEQARRDWERLGQGQATPLSLRDPQLAAARSQIAADEAALAQAERDLERCTVLAPSAAIIEERLVEPGQLVARGQALLRLRDRAMVEVPLPVSAEDLKHLALPVDFAGDDGPEVSLSADGRSWIGRIVRTTGAVDPRTRLHSLVARITLPAAGGLPLPGTFLTARIAGRTVESALLVPRHLFRRDGSLLLVGADQQLILHPPTVLRLRRDDAVIAANLPAGARLVDQRLESASAGTGVRIAGEPVAETSAEAGATP